jgi:hypothetical protein
MAENAGTIYAEIRLEIEKLKADGQKSQEYITKLEAKLKTSIAEAGEKAGTGFFAGVRKGFKETGEEAKKLGANVVKSLSPMLVAITAGIKVIRGIGNAIRDAFLSNEQCREGVDNLKSSLGESFSAAVRPVSNFFAGIIENAAKSISEANRLRDALKRLREGTESYGDTTSEKLKTIPGDYERIQKQIVDLTARIKQWEGAEYGAEQVVVWRGELEKLSREFEELENSYKDLMSDTGNASAESYAIFEDITAELEAAEGQIDLLYEKHAINDEKANQARISALDNYINAVSKLVSENKIAKSNINSDLDKQIARRNDLEAKIENETTFAALMASEAEKRAAELEKGRDAELAALNTRYAALAAGRESGALTEEEIGQRNMLTDAINQNYDALQKLAKTEAVTAAQQGIVQYSQDIDEQYRGIVRDLAEQGIMQNELLSDKEKELALNELNRNAALAEVTAQFAKLEAEREVFGLTEEEIALRDELTRKINQNYDAVAGGITAAKDEVVNFKEAAMQIAQAGVSAFSSITSAVTQITQMRAQEAMAEIDRMLEQELKNIEEARNAQLVAEGFMEAQRAEQMDAQIDAARAANDEVLQYQLERRQREMEINEEYDAQARAEEERARKKKAELEYKAAQAKYAMDISNSIVTGAMAITNAINSGMQFGPASAAMVPILTGIAAAGTAAQMAVIMANPPKMPAFATGGIVPGQPHGKADTVAAMVTPGEVILNRAQQEALAPQLGGGNLTLEINMDGKRMAEVIVENYINKGRILIDASRGIR